MPIHTRYVYSLYTHILCMLPKIHIYAITRTKCELCVGALFMRMCCVYARGVYFRIICINLSCELQFIHIHTKYMCWLHVLHVFASAKALHSRNISYVHVRGLCACVHFILIHNSSTGNESDAEIKIRVGIILCFIANHKRNLYV